MIGRAVALLLSLAAVQTAVAQSTSDSTPSARYGAPGAVLDPTGFAFARAIPAGADLTAIRLDPAALAHSRIDDLRIMDEHGRQVPYLIERSGELMAISLPTSSPSSSADVPAGRAEGARRSTAYHIPLPYAGLPDAVLRLGTSARVFERDVEVESPRARRDAPPDRRAAVSIARARWQHASPDSAAPPLELSLGRRLAADSLLILVNDGDNQRLPLTSAMLLLPTYRLRFFRQPGASLTLRYGHRQLSAPRYDLELLATRLTGADAEEVALGPELSTANPDPPTGRYLFWSVLGLASIALLGLIARLLRAAPATVR